MSIKLKRPIKQHAYFTSSINSEREKFEILESSMNFSKNEFANDVKEQMLELQVETSELSKATYINQHRLNSILSAKVTPTDEEIKIIKQKLHLTSSRSKMNAKKKLYTMAMMGAILSCMAQTSEREHYEKEQESNKEPKKPIIPKGCKEYHFTKSGRFDTAETMWSDIDYIFTCVASNDKTAIKKFEKFISNQK